MLSDHYRITNAAVARYLDNSEGSAWDNTLHGFLLIHITDIVVYVVHKLVAKTFYILKLANTVLQIRILRTHTHTISAIQRNMMDKRHAIVYLLSAKNRIIDHDAVNILVVVGFGDLFFQVLLVDFTQFKRDTGFGTCLGSPFSVLFGCRIFVGKESNEFGANLAFLDILVDLISERTKNVWFGLTHPSSTHTNTNRLEQVIRMLYLNEADTREASTVLQEVDMIRLLLWKR